MQTSHALDQALPTVTVDGFTYAVTPPDPSERHWYLIAEYLTCGNPAHRHNGPTGALRRFVVFADASGIHRGNMVQVGGIRVGRVQDVTLEDSTVVVRFEVDHGAVALDRHTAAHLVGEAVRRFELHDFFARPHGWRAEFADRAHTVGRGRAFAFERRARHAGHALARQPRPGRA